MDTDLKNVILVDNNPVAYSLQPQNGLPILSWNGNLEDQELKKLEKVLTFLAMVDDVRKYIPLLVDGTRGEILYHKLKEIQDNFFRSNIRSLSEDIQNSNKCSEELKETYYITGQTKTVILK